MRTSVWANSGGVVGLRCVQLLLLCSLVELSCAASADDPLSRSSERLSGQVTFTISLPAGIPLHQVMLGAFDELALGATVTIQGSVGSPVTLTDTGAGGAMVGSNARIQNLTSQGPIALGQGVGATGSVISGSTISEKSNVVVSGSTQQDATLTPFQQISWTVVFPSPGPAVALGAGATQALAPGAYGDVSMQPNATLQLSGGTYFLNSLSAEPQSTLAVDVSSAPALIYVASKFEWKGTVSAAGHEDAVFLADVGSDAVVLHAPFAGTIVAPNAALELMPVGAPGYRGSFFASSIDVQPSSQFTFEPSAVWGSIVPPTPRLECVIPPSPGIVASTAIFGYDNPLDTATTVPVGPMNQLTPVPPGGRTPGPVFQPGLHTGAFIAQFYGPSVTWTLATSSVTANAQTSPGCTASNDPFAGLPGLDPSISIVETGHPVGDPIILVDLDNPTFGFPLALQDVPLFPSIGPSDGGPELAAQEVVTDTGQQGTRFPFGQFFLNVDVSPPGTGGVFLGGVPFVSSPPCTTSPCPDSQPDQLPVWTAVDGDLKAPQVAPFQAQGLRVGYQAQPLNLTQVQEMSDESLQRVGMPVQVALDPHTLLVPVEVVVLVSNNYPITDPSSPVSKYNMGNELTFWDRNPGVAEFSQQTQAIQDPPSDALLSTTVRFQSWPGTVEDPNSGRVMALGLWTPDSIWSTCGVQFRMVNFFTIQTDDAHVVGNDSLCPIDGNQYLFGVRSLAESDPRHVPGTILVVHAVRCTCISDEGLDPTEEGARVINGDTACFPFDASEAITGAHEMGHTLGLCDAYADSSQVNGACPGDYQTNCATNRYGVMCSEDDKPVPTAIECQTARANAEAFSTFWQ